MRIYPEQLRQHLKQQIPSCGLIFGDEPLLAIEASEQIRDVAKSQGYHEKISYSLDGKFPSELIFSEFSSLSLFSERKIIELTLTKTSKENTAFIREITPLLNPDILLILQGPKLNSMQMNSAWFKGLEPQGIFINCNLPPPSRFPQWIFQRLKNLELQADKDVIDYLCINFEGNLLAAKQEFEKLALLYPKKHITLQQVEQSITTHNHFSLYQWVDSLFAADNERSTRIFNQVKAEGTELLLLTATLGNEIQKLLKLSYQSKKTPLVQLFNQQKPKLWPAKQKLISDALDRLSTHRLEQMVIDCAAIEIAIKVENSDTSWREVEMLSAAFF